MSTELSNHFKAQLANKQIDLDSDTIRICLMSTGYTFNKDTAATWADVSASQLAAGNGYASGGQVLTPSGAITEDDTNDRAEAAYDDVTWTASGGSIGPTPGAILYDDTTSDDTVIGYIDFGGDKTVAPPATITITGAVVRVA